MRFHRSFGTAGWQGDGMSDPAGEALVALLTAFLHQDGTSGVQIWRALEEQEKEDVVFLLIGFLERESELTSEMLGGNPKEFQESMLARAGEHVAHED